MSEERVLALKYRPHRFEDLVGQSTVSQTLSLALDSNRLSHAYLFSGLRGSGKTSTARIMAKALLCSDGPTSKPCEVCDNCKSANANRHLDIIEMDAASNRGIDDIKDLIEHTKYKPSSARFKVFIIDEVHMLTTQAFNALLKTLEEPPGFVKFILATTDPLKLPATILSRTQHFRFNKIASSDVIHHLSHILNEENIDYETEALEILSRSGQGSLRDTLTMLDQAIIFSKGSVTTPAVVDMLGLIDPEVMDNIFSTILSKGDITSIVRELENYEVSQVCDEMTIYLKHKMLEKDSRFELLLFDRFFRILGDAKHLLAINSDGGFVLILTLMKMIEATDIKTIDDIINQVRKVTPTAEVIPEIKVQEVVPTPVVEPVVQAPVVQTPVAHNVESVAKVEVKTIQEEIIPSPIEEKSTVEEEMKNIVVEGVVNSNPFDDIAKPNTAVMPDNMPETKIEEVTPADEALISSTNFVDLGVIDAIETVTYPNPFDESASTPESTREESIQNPVNQEEVKPVLESNIPMTDTNLENVVDEAVKEIVSAEVAVEPFEQQVSFNPSAEVEVVPVKEEIEEPKHEEAPINELYQQLTEKVYDRDYSLGECFEKNFIFNGYENNKLSIISYAQGDDRKFLYKHFGLIRTFAQDVYGNEVELDFTKEEPRQA